MKPFLLPVAIIASAVSLHPLHGQIPNPPTPKSGFVQDYAGVLSEEAKAQTNAICNSLWEATKTPLYVVILDQKMTPAIRSQGIEKLARNLFDSWGIGDKDRNYGTVLLVSPSARESRIEFGKDWNHRYDREAEEITETILVPNFRESNFDKGIVEGTQALSQIIQGLGLPPKKAPPWLLPTLITSGILVVGIAISLILNGKAGWGWALLLALGGLIFFLMKNSKSGPLGGGSSGGGGATGKW